MLDVLDRGSGPPILLLHGWSLDRTMWDPQVALLEAAGHRVVAPDLPGHGGSASVPALWFEDMAPQVLQLLDVLQVGPALVVGLSMGSAVALELALTWPRAVAGLLLADNAAADAGGPDRGAAAAARIRAATTEELVQFYPRLLFSDRFRDRRPDVIDRWADQFRRNDRLLLANIVAGYHARRDVRPLVAGLTVPTTVVFGTLDATTPTERRRDYEAVPGAVRHDIQGAGHLSNIEQPETFVERVLDLARRIPGFRPDGLVAP